MRIFQGRGPVLMRARVVAMAVVFAVLGACTGNPKLDAKEHIARAQQYMAKGNDRAVVIELKNALQIEPDNKLARSLLADVYLKDGAGPLAEKELARLVKLGEPQGRVSVRMARALLQQHEFKKTLLLLDKPADLPPDQRALAHQLRAEADLGLGDLDAADQEYRAALALDPKRVDAWAGRGRVALARPDYPQANRYIQKALEVAPGNKPARVLEGEYYLNVKDPTASRSAFEQVLKADPRYVPAILGMAQVATVDGKPDDVLSYTGRVLKVEPGNLLGNYLTALAYYNKHEFGKANDRLLDILGSVPSNMPTVLLLGATNFALGNYEQATMYLNRYLVTYPNSATARKLLAATRLKSKQPKAAYELLQPMVAAAPKDPQLLALLGEAAYDSGLYAQATQYFQRAVKEVPADSRLRTQLALGYLASGDTAQAIKELETTVDVGADPTQPATLLVQAYIREHKLDEALKAAQRVVEKDPKNPAALNLLGSVYFIRGDPAKAKEQFARAVTLDPRYLLGQLNLARLAARAGEAQQAQTEFKKVLTIDPTNLDAMVSLSRLRYAAKDQKGAKEWLDKARAAHPNALFPRLLLVQMRLADKAYPAAMDGAREMVAAFPNNPLALSLAADAYVAGGDKDSAVRALTHLVEIAPKAAAVWYRLGQLQSAVGSPNEAMASLATALKLRPDFGPALGALATLKVQAGHADQAMALAKQAETQQPKSPLGFEVEGDLHVNAHDYPAALRAYRTAYGKAPNGEIAAKWYAAARMGRVRGATILETIQGWVKASPKDVATRMVLANALMDDGKTGSAVGQYQKIIGEDPDNVVALNNLAWLYGEQGDPKALHYGREAYRLAPDQVETIDTLGWILVRQGQAKSGLTLLQKAVLQDPGNQEIRYHRAVALDKTGNAAAARADLETIIRSKAAFPSRSDAVALLKKLTAAGS
ncbi:MAG: hypothetical protein B7Z66_08005 [Chromatiales bacterium 21-64-14]|nr:MAG: hypothetical protein B7Z66_08005 [Chromatiales bacterium 21-64-14]HQU16076.1 PEP-CTERM system TPR-repeat protein PrsT [Gammaproteobacteria bacterium]